MNILFLNPPFGSQRPEGLDAPLGIMYLSAILKQYGHQCSLIDNVWQKEQDWKPWEKALAQNPDIVLINTQIRFTSETHEAVKKTLALERVPWCIGFGPQASTEHRRLLEMGFDGCVIGEPEEVIPQILIKLNNNGNVQNSDANHRLEDFPAIPGFATHKNGDSVPAPRVDVEALPFPDWDLVDYQKYIHATNNAVVMASRGFNTPDTFNQPPLIYATTPTYRCSISRIIEELRALRNKFDGSYLVLFHDEVFTENREWVLDLCSTLKQESFNLPFWCFTRPDLIDKELCLLMRECGFVGISMGMESGSDRILKLLKRELTVSQITEGFRCAQKAGLLTVGSVMIGIPGTPDDPVDESEDELLSTRQLVNCLHPDVLTVTLATPLPGTPLHGYAKKKIKCKNPGEFNYYHTWQGKYVIQQTLTAIQLTRGRERIRKTWKKKIWLTLLRMCASIVRNPAYRQAMLRHAIRVVSRKIFNTKTVKYYP